MRSACDTRVRHFESRRYASGRVEAIPTIPSVCGCPPIAGGGSAVTTQAQWPASYLAVRPAEMKRQLSGVLQGAARNVAGEPLGERAARFVEIGR